MEDQKNWILQQTVSRVTGQVLLFGLRVFKEPGVEAQELQKSGQAVTLKVFDIPKGILH
jgi:hypothetical protein